MAPAGTAGRFYLACLAVTCHRGGRAMKQAIGCIGVLIVGLLLVAALSGTDSNDWATRQLVQAAINKLPREPNWDRIEIDPKDNFALKLYYLAESRPSEITIRDDTYEIANAVLREFVVAGRRPADDGTFLWVWAEQPAGTGVTGKRLVLIYGHTEYNSEKDQLEWKPWKQ
jgi:hypothetical protein